MKIKDKAQKFINSLLKQIIHRIIFIVLLLSAISLVLLKNKSYSMYIEFMPLTILWLYTCLFGLGCIGMISDKEFKAKFKGYTVERYISGLIGHSLLSFAIGISGNMLLANLLFAFSLLYTFMLIDTTDDEDGAE